jgi:hypothetical protein
MGPEPIGIDFWSFLKVKVYIKVATFHLPPRNLFKLSPDYRMISGDFSVIPSFSKGKRKGEKKVRW